MNLKIYQTQVPLISSDKTAIINQYAPLNFIVDPFNLLPNSNNNSTEYSLPSKVYKIVYDWGDGLIETQKIFPSQFSDSPFTNYPLVKEKGDPRNFTKNHTYSLTDSFKKTIYVSVYVYMFNIVTPIKYNFTINLNAPKLDGSKTGFFKNIHLVKTKIFGKDNKILYIFEGKEPSWVFPVIVDWRVRGGNTTIIKGDDYDVYKLNI